MANVIQGKITRPTLDVLMSSPDDGWRMVEVYHQNNPDMQWEDDAAAVLLIPLPWNRIEEARERVAAALNDIPPRTG